MRTVIVEDAVWGIEAGTAQLAVVAAANDLMVGTSVLAEVRNRLLR
jgi:hypothetical protein